MIEVITKSRIASFSTCQRLHRLLYVDGYRSILPREYADFGTLFHAALDAWWTAHMGEQPLPGIALAAAMTALAANRAETPAVDDAAFAKAQILMAAYDARWSASMAEWEVIGVEVEFVAMIPGRRKLRVAGKLDKLLRKRADGSIWYGEHKTTSADLSLGSTYWNSLRMDPQVSIYFEGCRSLGYEPIACLYDVIVRPDQKPLRATPEEKRKYTKPTKTEPSRLYKDQRERDETLEEFQARIAGLITAEPDAYFARAEVVRLESELEESARDVEAIALQIRAGIGEHAPRNPAACHAHGRNCEFLPVCSGAGSLGDDTQFKKLEQVHPELTLASA